MPASPAPAQSTLQQEIAGRVRAMAARFAARAEAAEEARRIPPESVRDMLDGGLARILMPPRLGGYGLGLETWYETTLEISKADASHGWCAALITHHCHMIAQFPEEAQRAVWANGPDVAIAASIAPTTQVARVDGGYRVSGQNSAFASGVDHCAWAMIGGAVAGAAPPDPMLFAIPRSDYEIRDTWFTAGMRATGSKTIVTDNVFVPDARVLRLADMRQGKGAGGAIHEAAIYRTPFYFYAPLTFAAPMLGAAQGAYERFRDWTKTRRGPDGSPAAERTSTQMRMARAAADLDAADLLLRRTLETVDAPPAAWPQLVARSIRDFARASELSMAAVDTLVALSGTAGFAAAHPLQRAWRDIHFASAHIALSTEINYAHFGRSELGLPPDPARPFL